MAKLIIQDENKKSVIEPEIYGHFSEHLGRCIYEGLYGRLREFGKIDVMFLPINGRDGKRYRGNTIGNMTYQEAVDLAGTLKPGLVVPAHYEMFENNQEDPLLFADYISAKYPDVRYWIGGHGEIVW